MSTAKHTSNFLNIECVFNVYDTVKPDPKMEYFNIRRKSVKCYTKYTILNAYDADACVLNSSRHNEKPFYSYPPKPPSPSFIYLYHLWDAFSGVLSTETKFFFRMPPIDFQFL